MSDTVSSGAGAQSSSADRVLSGDEALPVYVIYGLLFVAPFTSGLTALIGGVMAHVLKGPGLSIAQSHIRFQIKIFWVSLLLTVPLVVGLIAAFTTFFTGVVSGIDLSGVSLELWVVPAFVLLCLLAFAGWVWILGASLFGVLKLANNRPIGRDDN